jgi:hypothetical protein
MSTTVTPVSNTSSITPTQVTPVSAPIQVTTSSATPIASVPVTQTIVTSTPVIKKDNSNDLEKNTVHIVITGIFVFIFALIILGLIGYFLFSHEEEAFRFRELFFPHKELVPKL